MKKLSQKMLTGLVLGSLMACGTAFAAEDNAPEFELDQIIVTATRTEKRDVDVPASTEIISQEQIKMSGATNAFEALNKLNGVEANAYWPGGAPFTTMSSNINIRGFGGGTLVMLNGNPLNLNNAYVIDAIPADQIEKIEVVKGGGAIMYGSEAMAGVVNIITKKGATNSVTLGMGNYGQRKYNVTVGDERLRVSYDQKKWGHIDGISQNQRPADSKTYGYVLDDNKKQNIDISYKFNDRLDVEFTHFRSDVDYSRKLIQAGTINQYRDSYTKQDMAQINYHDDSITAHAWYTKNKINYSGATLSGKVFKADALNIRAASTMGVDFQKNFKLSKKATLTTGLNGKHEVLDNEVVKGIKGDKTTRNIWGVYAQLDQKFDDKNSILISGRETWTTAAKKDNNFNNFSGAIQYVHKTTENSSIYAGVTQSFILPTFSQMYPSGPKAGDPNPDLNPMKGTNYEIGYKAISGNHTWKFAAFAMKVKDNITATWHDEDPDNRYFTYGNEDFKNRGVEASLNVKASEKLNYNLGFTIQNPQNKNSGKDVKNSWQRKFGRYQVKGGIDYNIGKLQTSLTGSYLFGRYASPSTEVASRIKPYFLTSLTTVYRPNKNNEISLAINNLLDREDNMSNTMSKNGIYYSTPINFLLSYTYKF